MKKTTLLNIIERYHMEEAAVGTLFWEAAQEDAEEHFIAIADGSLLYIIDTDDLEHDARAFHEGTVVSIQL